MTYFYVDFPTKRWFKKNSFSFNYFPLSSLVFTASAAALQQVLRPHTRGCWVIEGALSPARHRAIPFKKNFTKTFARVNKPGDSSGVCTRRMHPFCRFLLPDPLFFPSISIYSPIGSFPQCSVASVAALPQPLTGCVSARLSFSASSCGGHAAFRPCVPCDGWLVRQRRGGIKLLVT